MLTLVFLGAPRIERDGKRIEPDTRKAIALAAYLALTATTHNRDELAALLYPDADATRARAALRRTLSALKTALGEEALEVDRETVALNSERVRVDVAEFRHAAQGHDLRTLTRAAELYQGDFLTGFTLRDSPAFDEWQFFESESLRKQFATVLEQLAQHETERGEYKRAIEWARRWLALDPLHEPAHRALILLYARDGQRAAALRQYRECVRQLDRELGVAPLPETTELYHALEENRLVFPPTVQVTPIESIAAPAENRQLESAATGTVETVGAFPLVGRDEELQELLTAYGQISTDGCLLVIQGEAGIGKTRLAEEFLQRVRERGARVITARGYVEQRPLAYAPFLQALHTALEDAGAGTRLSTLSAATLNDAARLLPQLATAAPTPSAEGPGSQARLLGAVTELVLALTRGPVPGVLFLDDAQWLDDASLDLIGFLVRRLRLNPLCILLTWRGEEVTGDSPLRRLFADSVREGRARLITPARLKRAEVNVLVEAAAGRGAPFNADLVERLYRESEGQPFFLIEYLQLVEREGEFPDAEALPSGIRELLHSRLARTSETARQVLGAAAVLGHSFDFETVHAVSGRSEEETIAGLEELVAQALILESNRSGTAEYDFSHEKLRALVYDETSLARRRLLHRRSGDMLAQRARRGPAGAGQIAQHYRAAGADALAAEYYQRAGDYAQSVFAQREAIEHYTAALALGGEDKAALHQALGDAQILLGDYAAALTSYETSAAFAGTLPDAKIARVHMRRGDWGRATRHLEQALGATDDPAARARLYADLALARHESGDMAGAVREAERALELANRGAGQNVGLTQALAQAHNILGILARTRGDLDGSRSHLEQSAALAETLHDPGAEAAALNNLALVEHARGDDAAALALTRRALELVTLQGDRHRQAALYNHLADLYHAQGRTAESMEYLKRAVAIYAEIGGAAGAWQPEIWKLEEW